MGMLTDYERADDCRLLKNYIDGFGKFLASMDTMLGNVKAFGVKYPADLTEINAYLAAAKTQITAVLNKY